MEIALKPAFSGAFPIKYSIPIQFPLYSILKFEILKIWRH